MYAKYDFRKKPSSKEDEDEQPLYPRIVSNGTIDFQQIVKEIAQASSFTPADIEGVQLAIENKISEYLVSGHHVQLGNLGYFSAKLKARPVMDAKEIHAQSIYFDNVNFRPSSSFRKKVRGFVEKAKSGFAHSAEVPVEERRRRLEEDNALADREYPAQECASPAFATVLRQQSAPMAARSLKNLMDNLGESFTTRLLRLIDERGLKDSTVYKQSNISRQHFSKIQCNRDYNPKKKTVLAFAVGLHLSEDETIDLLKSAGYAFSDGSKRDWIVRYCLEQKIYNINQVNTLLFEYDQEQLGA